jgi:hypothetical protein
MTSHARIVCTLLFATTLASAVCPGAAQAADNTRYVSITGDNANACTLAAPCRTLQYGINQTPEGGELRILDSGDYGDTATIRKSLTISGNGNTVYLGSPITINRRAALVALRELVLNGEPAMIIGINIVAATAVHIERCTIHGFQDGIRVTAPAVEVFVLDSISRDNSSSGLSFFTEGESRLTVDNSRFENNHSGVSVHSGRATITRSTASGNNGSGITASVTASVSVMSTMVVQNLLFGFFVDQGGATLTVESSLVHGNGTGLIVGGGASARVSHSTFTNNTAVGILNHSGTIETRRNNTVRGNGTNVDGTLTPIGGV